jgi:FAD/FMN-containing dehydrogenase
MSTAAFLEALAAALSPGSVSQAPGDLETYGRDWTRVHAPAPSAVVFPRSIADVTRAVRLANEHGVARGPLRRPNRPRRRRGGRQGRGGALSLEKMRHMDPVDVVGAHGARRGRRRHGGRPSSYVRAARADVARGLRERRARATVGGNIATNAGGVKVIRYGLTRQWVLGLEVVTRAGELLEPQRSAREEQHGHRPAPALHRVRGHARRRSARRPSSSRSLPGQAHVALLRHCPASMRCSRLLRARCGPRALRPCPPTRF